MSLPFTLPSWLPWWVPILVLIPLVPYAVALIIMPFSVIGLKSRLDMINSRLDDIDGEIRTLALRLPEPRGDAVAPARYVGRAEPKLNWPR
jgi:hypothetical protein